MPIRKMEDLRPPVAIGRVEHRVTDVSKAADWHESLGARPIVRQRNFALLELRGGIHMVLGNAKEPIKRGTPAPFDFIVDDVDATRRACAKLGMKPSRMTRGSNHDWFEVIDPRRYVPFLPLTEPITLKALKRKQYMEHPGSLGEHLRKRRLELQMSQVEAGKQLGVKGARFGAWERDEVEPQSQFHTAIRSFLGYDPGSVPSAECYA